MPDAIFADARLAAIYDGLDPDRSDLVAYAALVAQLGARRVLDLGCGTGTFAVLLAERGLDVVGSTRRGRRWMSRGASPGAEAVRPGGQLVFETRVPAARAWTAWNRIDSETVTDIAGVGAVRSRVEVLDVSLPLVTFRWTYIFTTDGAVLTSDSTLRFRERDEVERDLAAAGFLLEEARDAPDRPGREYVFLARRPP